MGLRHPRRRAPREDLATSKQSPTRHTIGIYWLAAIGNSDRYVAAAVTSRAFDFSDQLLAFESRCGVRNLDQTEDGDQGQWPFRYYHVLPLVA